MINKVGISEQHALGFNTYVAPPIYQDVPAVSYGVAPKYGTT